MFKKINFTKICSNLYLIIFLNYLYKYKKVPTFKKTIISVDVNPKIYHYYAFQN